MYITFFNMLWSKAHLYREQTTYTTAIPDNVNFQIQVWYENKLLYFVQSFLETEPRGSKREKKEETNKSNRFPGSKPSWLSTGRTKPEFSL